MANGPFQSYLPPSVTTKTESNTQLSGPPTGLQIPIFLGTGKETLSQVDYELIRGSSSVLDQLINEESVSSRFIVDETNPDKPVLGAVDGQSAKFKVKNLPIVIGNGQGLTTNRPQDVDVTVDDVPVVVAAVDGSKGIVTLQVPPPEGATVKVTYYFNRTDTLAEDDVSDQVSSDPAVLLAPTNGAYIIMSGTNDVLNLKVNGVEHEITLQGGTLNASGVATDINSEQIAGLTASADVDNQGNTRLQLSSDGSLEILGGSANDLFGFRAGQKTDRNQAFHVYEGPIVTGEDGGITTTDVGDVEVYVNGQREQAESVDGSNGLVTLTEAPLVGSTVVIKYYFNSYQDTFDYLPNKGITTVDRVGNAPGRNDYIRGLDYVVSDDRILWGTAATIEAGQFTASGSNDPFDETQITTTLRDDKLFLEPVDRLLDRTTAPPGLSDKTVVLGNVPTKGDGLDTPTKNPSLVEIYHGPDLATAVAEGKVTVTKVDPETRQVTVKEAIPAGHEVFATYYYSRLLDDTYTITRTQSGKVKVASDFRGENLFNVKFGTSSGLDSIEWPSGVQTKPDAYIVGVDGVNEEVEITFASTDAAPFVFTNGAAGPYDIFDSASDVIELDLADGVDSGTVSVDLSDSGFAVLVSESHESAATYNIDATNDTFEFQVDGTTYTVSLSQGATQTLTDIADDIETAAPGTVRTFIGVDADYLLLRSTTSPTNPSEESSVRILNGNANDLLGFTAYDKAEGALSAVNKGATILSGAITQAMITNLASNETDFIVSIDGVEYTVDGSKFSGITTLTEVRDHINSVIGDGLMSGGVSDDDFDVASVTIEDTDKIRITSKTVDSGSSVEIGSGAANQYVGFTGGDVAGQRKATASEIVSVLNSASAAWEATDNFDLNTAGTVPVVPALAATEFFNYAYAEVVSESGYGDFIKLTSFEFGLDVSLTFQAPVSNSAYNDTGIGIEAGDSVSGTDSEEGQKFDVSSTTKPTTGSGGTGIVGQTYTDDRTGLRFTVLDAEDGIYTDGESFTLVVEEEMEVGSATVNRSIPGVELYISPLTEVAVNDTAIITTYDKSGDEPGIGDYYYITYDYTKEDFSAGLFTRFREIQANYGSLSPDNPLTLACYLALLNGAALVSAKQVKKSAGAQQANDADYISALNELKKPIQAGIRPDIIVPLTTSTAVMAAVTQHCEIQSSPRNRNECRALFGVASGTRPQDASQLARNLNSERATILYPDSALLSLTNELGESTTYIVDGTFMAAAIAGVIVSPANDVATPLTRRTIIGFERLNRSLDEVEMNQLATSGVTVLQDRTPYIEVRQGLTSNTANRLTSTPSIIAIKDFVQQQSRATLERFIGLKFLTNRAQDVELALTGLLNSLVENQIITSFQGVTAEPDPNDPTILRVSAFYSPVFPLLYIPVTFTISAS